MASRLETAERGIAMPLRVPVRAHALGDRLTWRRPGRRGDPAACCVAGLRSTATGDFWMVGVFVLMVLVFGILASPTCSPGPAG